MDSATENLRGSFLYQLFDSMDLNLESDGNQNEQEQQKRHLHVLAVDDSHIDRKLLERLLTVSSYQVTCVDSGDKALEYLGLLENTDNDSTTSCSSSCCTSSSSLSPQQEASKVNLIMTDYSMPGMSGYDLLKRVKESSWKNVPVVVMSSENVPSRINMCLEGGAEQFLLKPVKLSDLRELQSHILNPLSNSCKHFDDSFVDDNTNNGSHSCKHFDDSFVDDNTNNGNDNNDNDSDKKNNNSNKRKAMSPDCSERRPKITELVVL
ncbi:unnamed protein product [Ilex paraguariensis]|uniref:Response regulatory domain-containing protein n=1 Tax=Ilex paraguariensis TaxID=185542 RepID=A0ABC8RDW5_9AQUA